MLPNPSHQSSPGPETFPGPPVDSATAVSPVLAAAALYPAETQRSREAGMGKVGLSVITALGVLAGVGGGFGLAIWHNVRPRTGINAETSTLKARTLEIKPTAFTPITFQAVDASGSQINFDRQIAGRSIPQASTAIILKEYTIPGRTGIVDDNGKTPVVITKGQAKPGDAYVPVTVTIPLESIATEFTKPDPAINKVYPKHDDGLELVLSGSGAGKAASRLVLKAGCEATKAAVHSDLDCDALIDNIAGDNRAKDEARMIATAEKKVDDFVRNTCGTTNWPTTRAVIADFYGDQAVAAAGGDLAAATSVSVVFTKNGQPTTEAPSTFRDPTTEELQNIGIIAPDDSMGVTIQYPKNAKDFTCTPAPTYTSKYRGTLTVPSTSAPSASLSSGGKN